MTAVPNFSIAILLFLIIPAAIFAGLIVLQIALCKLPNKLWGLILPILSGASLFSTGLIFAFNMMAGGRAFFVAVLILIVSIIPCITFTFMYIIIRKKMTNQSDEAIMDIQNL